MIVFDTANGIMVPDRTILREIHRTFHYGPGETVLDLFGHEWDSEIEPVIETPCLEPIDNDPTINALLAAENL